MTSRQRREANLGFVLMCISIIFIICQSVKIVPDLYEMIYCRIGTSGRLEQTTYEGENPDDGHYCRYNDKMDTLIHLSHLLLAINSSVNVIIYMFRGIFSLPKVAINH